MGAPPPMGARPPIGPPPGGGGAASASNDAAADAAADDAEDAEDEEARQMAAMMGFSTFDSTAGKDVGDPRCKLEAVKKRAPRKYRQYMNRRGGFNRPLDEQ